MSLRAITREVSPSFPDCELSYHLRQPIDLARARAQHMAYCDALARLRVDVVSLPAAPDLPDSVFVEDAAVVVDEVAIITRPGALTRRPETTTMAEALAPYRPLQFLTEPATLDGGDVLRIGRDFFIGLSRRTNRAAFEQMADLLRPHGYSVQALQVKGCLHLKSAASWLGDDRVLVHRPWLDVTQPQGIELIDVDPAEPAAANVLVVGDTIVMPACFPQTRALLESRGYHVQALDVSELQKAEAGVTCCSILLEEG